MSKRLKIASALIFALSIGAGCTPKVMAPRIPAMQYGEKAPFGPETLTAPIREAPEEIKLEDTKPEAVKPSKIIK